MSDDPLLRTPLFGWHQSHGGRMVEFGGWSMPVQYGSIVEEHQAVRRRAGLFDISHMGRLDFRGPDALPWIERATTNHVARTRPGQVQYGLMANEDGGVLDDVLVYHREDGGYSLVCNASNRRAVLERLASLRGGSNAEVEDRTVATAMIAVQGPESRAILERILDAPLSGLKYYATTERRALDHTVAVSRTGYTGEDGFEVVAPAGLGEGLWNALLAAGEAVNLVPCGLGARDTLRFEAGMPLYGHELSETINPYAAGLGWAVKLDKGEFVGREALRRLRDDPGGGRVGLELDGKRIARQGCAVLREGREVGAVTSGTFAPTLERSLAMALVEPSSAAPGAGLRVDVRGREETARVVPLPFYRRPRGGSPTD